MGLTNRPQRHINAVAKRKLLANGAITIAVANIRWPEIQVVNRLGLNLPKPDNNFDVEFGNWVVDFFSSGDSTRSGRAKAPVKVIIEYNTSDVLPIRPMSPSTSFESFASSGTSYR